MTFRAKAGYIYKISVPFSDLSANKLRPVLAISNANSFGDFEAVFITTKNKDVYNQIEVPEGLLPRSSVINVGKRFILNEKIILKEINRVELELLKKVLKKILELQTYNYYEFIHKPELENSFIPGKSKVNYGGRIFDEQELLNLVDSSLDFWLTYGKFSKEFEKKFAHFLGVKYALTVNSGSSANLLAFYALTSPLLKERRVKRGDEVITIAAGFPTTVAPIIQYGAIPVFVDVELETHNIDIEQMKKALSSKTKAVMVAHTLGNPFNIKEVKQFCDEHSLWLIEDNCDALGSKYLAESTWTLDTRNWTLSTGNWKLETSHSKLETGHSPLDTRNWKLETKYTGTFGDIGTSSFYPPHHITMGEGGAVYTNNPLLKKIMLSMRDWGRDCWCDSGKDDTCGCRFTGQFGKLPKGYDHKYVYSHFGFNLKITDMQAAVGCAQLDKLEYVIKRRQDNFNYLFKKLKKYEDIFILPKATIGSEPSWFGFLIILKDNLSFFRNELVEHLEKNLIQTRNLFAGNILKHPCFEDLKESVDYKVIGSLENTDKIMNDAFWIGVYPGMTEKKLEYMVEKIGEFVENFNLK